MKKKMAYCLRQLILLLVFGLVFVGESVATTGSISGVVQNSSGEPLAGIRVGAYLIDDEYNAVGGLISTASDDPNTPENEAGTFTINGLPLEQTYKVRFVTTGTNHVEEWYNNSSDFTGAQELSLTAASPTADVGIVQLATGATITGTVTFSDGSPSSPVYVQAYVADSLDWVTYATVDSTTGAYTLQGLPGGNYDIRFWAYGTGYVTEWYDDEFIQLSATSVSVVAGGTTTGIDAALTLGGEISGQVSDVNGGIEGALVKVFDATDSTVLLGFTITAVDSGGAYTVTGLPFGMNLKVQFHESEGDGTGSGMTEWYDNQSNFSTATTVSVEDAGIDAVLEPRDTTNLVPVYMLLGLL
ncbi:MAG: carboxypeptidase-like regulatory domain-containing protein [Candidatus Electrothrix aestuarii]|uniref:Carboxypeptidase-like regulatory domain-containing protein n=1 Tax=Candidatus Electrothrix aestuarii TaxID=3062594 RepID=A0AAU8LYH6_9BACT|nr:carboxypeptidase-like regulatory domain-containing protein [Candidatus Electrothrix aestuarii]